MYCGWINDSHTFVFPLGKQDVQQLPVEGILHFSEVGEEGVKHSYTALHQLTQQFWLVRLV